MTFSLPATKIMAFYTPPSLPRTPAAYTMNATLPSIRTTDLLSWASWRNSFAPLTPPMTSTFQSRTAQLQPVRMTLPPIAHLERHISAMQPLTPPEDIPPPQFSRLPPIVTQPPLKEDIIASKPHIPEDAPHLVDWLDVSRTFSAQFIAEKTCEMICYLWFSSPAPEPTPNSTPPFTSRTSTSTLQLVATRTFVQFMQKLLETTQVSQSVIVLSLHYIYRLKERNRFTPAQPGSEFRIAVAGLMMANKFLDDNTYTNKTWSEVSGIELQEINRMEREFLMGVDFNLYVDKTTYESWLNLLKGLVMAKERDTRHFRKSRGISRSSRQTNVHTSAGPTTRTYGSKHRVSSYRARSSSPASRPLTTAYSTQPFSHAPPALPAHAHTHTHSPTPRPGSKRTAADAFSPTTATFSQIPTKRPVGISLQIPDLGPSISGPGSSSHSPLESLQSFAKMSLASPLAPRPSHHSHRTPPEWVSGSSSAKSVPETLVTAYSLNEDRRANAPQNLYYYSLACSPMDSEVGLKREGKKNRLRYHQAVPPSTQYAPILRPPPMHVVQSASTSPHDMHMNVTSHALPHFHDNVWARPPVAAADSAPSAYSTTYSHPPSQQQYQSSPQEYSKSPVPSAPFANAGPPGVHFYPTPRSSSVYPPSSHTWPRNRRY